MGKIKTFMQVKHFGNDIDAVNAFCKLHTHKVIDIRVCQSMSETYSLTNYYVIYRANEFLPDKNFPTVEVVDLDD